MKRLVHFPKIRLTELVKEFGGANRADATAGAQNELESMRAEADRVIGETLSALEAIAGAGMIHPVQPSAICAHPEALPAVFIKREHFIAAKRERVLVPVSKMDKGSRLLIQHVKAIAVSAKPEVLLVVDKNFADIVAAETCGISVTMDVLIATLAVG